MVGMHRSGTSLTMRVLRQLGMEVGPEDSLVTATAVDGRYDYLEQRAFVELDNELLAALGGHVSEPASAPPQWHAEPRFAAHHARARELVRTTFDGAPWGWKDPRAALLLPFWQTVIPGMRTLICIRNPAEVAASMLRRNPHSYNWGHWLRMWLRHTADALDASAAGPRMVLIYEDLLAAPEREAGRLGAFLLGTDPTPEQVRAAAATVRPADRHQRVSDAMLADDERTPAEFAFAYMALRTAVRDGEGLEAVTRLVARTSAALVERDALAAELERLQAEHETIAGSRSWRVTAPLRSLAARARKR